MLDNATDKSAPIASITFYDTEERPVKTVSTTHLANTHEQTETTYTLDNQPRKVSHTLKYKDDTYDDSYEYSYDRVGRLTGVTASLPWANLIDMNIGADAYNSIGQLVSSGSGSSATTYSYDIRGAISGLSNSAVKQSITRNANGTISKIIDNGITHTFEYDKAGRLVSETCDNSDSHTGIFSSTYTYDRNSNITSLTRTGYPGGMSYPAYPVDDLKMTYDGNRLVKVADYADEVMVEKSFDFYDGAHSATEYTYDANGNVTRDDNRRLTAMTYNALNLPSRIEVGKDEAGEAIIDYIYDGAGNKLGTRSLISYFSDRPLATYAIQEPCRAEDHDYIGNYEFKNGQVHRVNTPYGYMAMGMFFTYLRDYQGNNRNHASYYAYGLPVQGSEVKDPDPYLYGSKEFYSLKGVNLYDFNARTYAADIARFMQPDPNASDYHWLSPYAYCGGDPINFIDPDGCDFWYTNDITEITNFYNTIISGGQICDFSNWIHLTDTDFLNNLVYDDDKCILYATYCTVADGEFTVNCSAYNLEIFPVTTYSVVSYSDIQVHEPVNGIWDEISYRLDPWTYNDGITTWSVGKDGRISGFAPKIGYPPLIGKGKILKAGKWLTGGKEKMGKAIGKMSGNRAVQQQQIDYLAAKYHLTPKQRRILHDEVSHQGLGFHEIEEFIIEYFSK